MEGVKGWVKRGHPVGHRLRDTMIRTLLTLALNPGIEPLGLPYVSSCRLNLAELRAGVSFSALPHCIHLQLDHLECFQKAAKIAQVGILGDPCPIVMHR